jgi:hypothetical protein
MLSRSTSRSAAAVRDTPLVGVADRGGALPAPDEFPGNGLRWASPVDQPADFAESALTAGSEPPPGKPPASDDDSDCGTPGAP